MNVWKQRLILLLGVLCTELACNLALLPRSVWTLFLCLTVLVLLVRVRPKMPTKPMKVLRAGCDFLVVFLVSATLQALLVALLLASPLREYIPAKLLWRTALWSLLLLAAVFWIGMLQIYFTSVQLGIKQRVLAALCGWIPGVNIWYLIKMLRICNAELEFETEKWELSAVRAESELCKTKYPLLLVHGVFFRDFRYVNYWGRIPKELMRNGATLFYGEQQSAASVEASGRELAERILQIIRETGCEKVNIIAHSKGGLDSRAAISHCGCASFVASLTSINTPHKGCIFAEYLLRKVPERLRNQMAAAYNGTLKHLGDKEPDFLSAVTDLTESACLARNERTPDAPGVLYESVMSFCRRAQNGKFPLNVTYPLVKHFDGQNDGLVAVDSARWGSRFTLLEPTGKRGISHGDVVDINRENIRGYDVREFYVNLVADLKRHGY